VVEQHARERMIESQFFEHLSSVEGAPKASSSHGNAFFSKSISPICLGEPRLNGCRPPCELFLEVEHLLAQLVAHRIELARFDQHARPLHPVQDFAHRHLVSA